MAGDGEIIGGIGLEVFASYDGLQADIDTAVGMVQGGSDKMAEAVDSAFAGPTSNGITTAAEETSTSLLNLASAAGDAGPPINSLDELLKQLVDSGQTLQEALQTAALSQFSSDAQDLAATMGIVVTNATEAADQLADIGSAAAGAGSDAASAAEQLSLFDEAVQVPYAEAAGQLNMFATEMEPIAGAAKSAAEEAVDLADKIAQTGDNANKAAEGIHKAGEEAESAGHKAGDAAHGGFEHLATELLEFAGIELSLHALKELGEFAMEASDGFTQATISLTALTGSSEEAHETLEKLEELGQKDGMAMPALETAATRLTALLPPGTDVVSILGKIADGAAAMHTSIETAAQKFAILTETGNFSAKMLSGFGLTTTDVKDAMESLGLSADTNAKKLDQHDRILIMEEALGKLKGTAEEVANNTFGGMWTKMANQFEATMVQAGDAVKPFAQTVMPMLGTALKGIVAAFAEVIFAVKETVDVVVGMVATLVAGFTGLGEITQKMLSGDLKGAAQSAKDAWSNMGAAISHTWDDMKADAKSTGDFLDNLGKKSTEAGEKSEGMGEKLHGVTLTLKDHQDAIKKLAESDLPAAIAAQQKFAEQMAASAHPIQAAASAYADMAKLVDKLAKENIPAAMDAQQGMINSMIATDQPAGAVAEAYSHIQSFIQKLAKEDIPAAVIAQNHFIDSLIATDQPASAVRLAFEEQQKLIQALAKQDLPDAIAQQQQYIMSLKDTDQPLTMVLTAYKEQQTLIKQMATEDLPLAIDLQGQLIDELTNTAAPAETVRAAYAEQEKMLKGLADQDLPAAILKQQELIDKMRNTEQPVNDVRKVFQDMETEIKALSQTDIPAAIQQQQYLIDKLIATKQPAEDVRRAYEDEQRIIQQLAREDIQAAIDKQQALIDKMLATKQPAQDVIGAYQEEQKLIKQLGQTDLPGAITQQQILIDKLVATHQPAQVVQQAFQQMQSDISTLATTSLPAAITAQQGMIDKLIATHQPLQLVVKAFEDEQGMISKMAQTDIPAAITAQQNLIDKLIATQQPALEVQRAYDAMRGIISTMSLTDLPGAIDKLQAFTQKTIDAHGPAQDLAKDFSQQSAFISQLAKIDLPAAIDKQAEYIQQMKDAGRPLSDILKAQTDIDKMEIQLSQDRGTSASKWIIDLENIRQKQKDIADSVTNVLGNAYTGLMKTWNDAWDAVGKTLADQLVTIDKTDTAWTKMLKGIEKEILDNLIGVALKALRSEVDSLITSLIPSLGDAFKGVAGGISGAFTPAMTAASNAAQTAAVNAATLGANAASAAPSVAALGSGAASAGSAASSVGGAFGSFGASLNVVSGAVSAVSGVIGNFQMAAMNATMSLVEVNTRITALVTQKELPIISATGVQEELTLNSIWASMLDTATHQYDRLGDIWNQLRELQQHVDMTTDEVNGMRFGVNAPKQAPTASAGAASVLIDGPALAALNGIWGDANLLVDGIRNLALDIQALKGMDAAASQQAATDFKNLFATGDHIGSTLVDVNGNVIKTYTATGAVAASTDSVRQEITKQTAAVDAGTRAAEDTRQAIHDQAAAQHEVIASSTAQTTQAIREAAAAQHESLIALPASMRDAGDRIVQATHDSASTVSSVMRDGKEAVLALSPKVDGVVSEIRAAAGVQHQDASAGHGIIDNVRSSIDALKGGSDQTTSAVKEHQRQAHDDVTATLTPALGNIRDEIKSATPAVSDRVTGSVRDAASAMHGDLIGARDGITQEIRTAAGAQHEAVTTARDGITQEIRNQIAAQHDTTAAVQDTKTSVASSVERSGRDVVEGVASTVARLSGDVASSIDRMGKASAEQISAAVAKAVTAPPLDPAQQLALIQKIDSLMSQEQANTVAITTAMATGDMKTVDALIAKNVDIAKQLTALDEPAQQTAINTGVAAANSQKTADAANALKEQAAAADQKAQSLQAQFEAARNAAQAAVAAALRDGTIQSMQAATKAQADAAALYGLYQQAQKVADDLDSKAAEAALVAKVAAEAAKSTADNTAAIPKAVSTSAADITTQLKSTAVDIAGPLRDMQAAVHESGKSTDSIASTVDRAGREMVSAVQGPTATSTALDPIAANTKDLVPTLGQVSTSLDAIQLATASLVDIELIRQGIINLNISLQQVYKDIEAQTDIVRLIEGQGQSIITALQLISVNVLTMAADLHTLTSTAIQLHTDLLQLDADVKSGGSAAAFLTIIEDLDAIDSQLSHSGIQLEEINDWSAEIAGNVRNLQEDLDAIDSQLSHSGVQLEEINAWTAETAANVKALQDDLDAIDSQLSHSGVQLEEINGWTAETSRNVKALQEDLDAIDSQLSHTGVQIEEINGWVAEIAAHTGDTVAALKDIGTFTDLSEKHLAAIEKSVGSVSGDLASILGDLQTKGTDDTPGMSIIDAVVVMTKAAVSIDESLKTNAAEGGTKTAAEYLKELLDVNTSGLNRVVQAINEQMGKLITTFNEKFAAGFDKVVTALDTDSGNIVTAISEAASAIVGGVSGAVSGLGSMISAAIGAVGSAVSSLAGAIGGAITTLNSQITTVATGLSNLSAREASDVTNLQAAIAAIPPPLGMDDIQNAISAALSGAGGGNNAPSSNNAGTGSEMSPGYQAGQSGGHYANDGTWIPDRYVPSSNALASYDLGGYVPKDMIANLHAGEFVLTPDVVKALGGVSSVQQIFMPSGLGAPAIPGYAPTVGAAGAAGMAGNNAGSRDTFLFNFNGITDAREMAEVLIGHLRIMSPKFKTLSVI